MSPTPWWLTVLVGVLTVAGSFLADFIGAGRARPAAGDQRTMAITRQEWFKRFQWAAELALRSEPAAQAAGFAVLKVLASSELASEDDISLLSAVESAADIAAAKARP